MGELVRSRRAFVEASREGRWDFARVAFDGVSLRGMKLRGNFSRASFVGSNLSGAVVSGPSDPPVDFEGPAVETDFRRADLEGATLAGNLNGANFRAARLRGATFDASLTGAAFGRAYLRDAVFLEPWLERTSFVGANARGAKILCRGEEVDVLANNAIFDDSEWRSCAFEGLAAAGASFRRARFDGCSFAGGRAPKATFEWALFHQSDFWDVDLGGTNLSNATFIECRLSRPKALATAESLTGLRLHDCELSDPDRTFLENLGAKVTYGEEEWEEEWEERLYGN